MTSPRGESNYNSIIERSIQTKLNMAFAMLDASPLSSTGWNLAMAHATFIQARCPRRSNQGNITPYEQFFGVKPDLSSLATCIRFYLLFPYPQGSANNISSSRTARHIRRL